MTLITRPYNYSTIDRVEIDSKRYYATPSGNLPSVTTILHNTADKEFINEWVERVGTLEADRIKNEAADVGSALHQNLENYIYNNSKPTGLLMVQLLSKAIINRGLSKVNEVWGCEIPLYFDGLYAGTADLIGLYNRCAIDY